MPLLELLNVRHRRGGLALIAPLSVALFASSTIGGEPAASVIYENDFEQIRGLSAWPGGAVIILDGEDPKSGLSSISFGPDSNYVAYVFLDVEPNHRYSVSLDYRADRAPLDRNGVKVNFNREDGGNGSAGKHEMSFGSITTDNAWHAFEGTFVTPPDAVKIQFILDFYRTGANVFIDNLVIRDLGEASDEAQAPDTTSTTPKPDDSGAGNTKLGEDLSESDRGWSAWFKPDQASFAIDTDQKRSGEGSIRITGADDRHILAHKIKVEPGAIYKITFAAKTEGDKIGNSAVTFDFFPTNAEPRPYIGLKQMAGDKPWEEFTFYAEAPADAEGAYLSLIHNSGTIWFDDIRVEEDE
ncbi:MAG: carbohydrate binding domain-containing protein [Planctomycetota bacterium]